MHGSLKMVAAAALVWGVPVMAESPTAKSEGKIICRSERMVGSNISSRICKTREEWAAGTERDKRWLEKNSGKLFFDPAKPDGGGAHIGPTNGGGGNRPGG